MGAGSISIVSASSIDARRAVGQDTALVAESSTTDRAESPTATPIWVHSSQVVGPSVVLRDRFGERVLLAVGLPAPATRRGSSLPLGGVLR